MGEFCILPHDTKRAVLASNTITNQGALNYYQSLLQIGTVPGTPLVLDWDYIAVGMGTTTIGSTDNAMGIELARVKISNRYRPTRGTASLVGLIRSTKGNGPWSEVAIFDDEDIRAVLYRCEGTADIGYSAKNWWSDGVLTTESTIVREGNACIRAQMGTGGSIPFDIGQTYAGYPPETMGTTDYLQFWYRSSAAVGTIAVRYGQGWGDYWRWDMSYGTAEQNTWQLFNQQIMSGTTVGSPQIFGVNRNVFFAISHGAVSQATYYEYLDYINLFKKNGNMLAHGTVDYEKEHGTDVSVFYNLKGV